MPAVLQREKSVDEKEEINILLVDDNSNNLFALSAILDRPDYRLITAKSGRDALSLLLREEFALVLLDVMMPDMDGFAVASTMKEREKTRYIPIIFVTAVAKDLRDIFHGYTVGAVDYIQKPLEAAIVRAKVSVFVDLFRKTRRIQQQAEFILNSERAQFLEHEQTARLRAQEAELKYSKLVHSLDHAIIWEADPNLSKFTFVSQRVERLLGYRQEQWLSESNFFIKKIPPEDLVNVLKAVEKELDAHDRDELGRQCEHKLICSDGSERWFHTGVQAERDRLGKAIKLRGLSVDIHPLKEVERALRDSEERLDLALNSAQMGMWDWNLITGSLIWSDIMKGLFGYKPGEFPGNMEGFWKVIVPSDRELVSQALKASFERDETFEAEYRVEWPDKTVHWIHAKGKTFRDSTQRVIRMSGTASEITERKRVEEEREHLVRDLHKAVQAHQEVVAVVAHDLKNPLTAVDLCADVLLKYGKNKKDDTMQRLVERIKKGSGRALKFTQDILDVTKVEAGRFAIDPTPGNAKPLILEVMDVFRPLALEKSIDLKMEFKAESCQIYCDPDRMMQVFFNLIGNAIKFIQQGGEIWIKAQPNNQNLLFTITDTGPGIPSDELPHLFERFWQAKKFASKKGLGLGLYIAKGIIEAHGGKIWVESKEGHGTSFYFTIPMTKPAQKNSETAA
jgi:PAS domain S-box-containing protein